MNPGLVLAPDQEASAVAGGVGLINLFKTRAFMKQPGRKLDKLSGKHRTL